MEVDIGVVFQDIMINARLTVMENILLEGMYELRGELLRRTVDMAIRISDSNGFADRPYGKLSGGQRCRADIARALVHGPRLLLFDEPIAGLDPRPRSTSEISS